MGGHDRCCVARCDSDKRKPDKIVKRSHVQHLIFHAFPKDERRKQCWIAQVSKGLKNFRWGNQVRICSNHFIDGKPTSDNGYPTLFFCERDFDGRSPRKRTRVERAAVPEPNNSNNREKTSYDRLFAE